MSNKPPKLDTIGKMQAPKLATVSGTNSKETVYVDVDDEITTIIEKVRGAKGKIVALVLPKRATVLQSIVNMKLLKRTVSEAGKNLVLVTTEAGLLPLAGLVGLHVADTPTSRPTIPSKPDQPSDEPEAIEEPLNVSDNSGSEDEFNMDEAANVPIGELASSAGAAAVAGEVDDELVMNDTVADKPDVTPVKKNKKLAIPNFDKFRTRLILGAVLLIALVAGWIVAAKVLPKATISIETNSQLVKSNLSLTLDTAAKQVDVQNKILPATAQSVQKTYSQQVATTGQQNNGAKASGSVYFALTDCKYNTVTIPTGSGISVGNKTYITQSAVTLNSATIGGQCNPSSLQSFWSATATVIALQGGSDYNTAKGTTFSVSSSISGAGSVAATASSDIAGGTDSIVKIVAQADIDNAKAQIAAQDQSKVKQELESDLQAKGILPIVVTYVAGSQQVTTSANVGDAADTVTVTSVIPYTMLGVQTSDLRQIVVASVDSQIDASKQKILDDGIAHAQYTIQNAATPTSAVVSAQIQSIAGPELDAQSLKKQIAGKKSGDVTSAIGSLPGVTKVDVKYSPFWVTTAPTNTNKITLNIAMPSGAN